MVKAPKPGKRVIVTPRMLRAGALALATMGADTSEYEMVGLVYRAMASVARRPSRRTTRRPPTSWKSCGSCGPAAATSERAWPRLVDEVPALAVETLQLHGAMTR